MLFVVGGIPDGLFHSFQQQARSVFNGDRFVAIPLAPAARKQYTIAQEHCDALIGLLARECDRGDPSLDDGVGVLYFAPYFYTSDIVDQTFYPSCLCKKVDLPFPTETSGGKGRECLRKMLEDTRRAAGQLKISVSAMATELRARQNRTPLSLPLTNFRSNCLDGEIRNLFTDLPNSNSPRTRIEAGCRAIENQHPFHPKAAQQAFFQSGSNFIFRMPGRDLHGDVWQASGTHLPKCRVNAAFRLSGPIGKGFHFDCFGANGGQLVGRFADCHGILANWQGEPHLNIAPNDFVRK